MTTLNLTIEERIERLPAYLTRILTNMPLDCIDVNLVYALETADDIDLNGSKSFAMNADTVFRLPLNEVGIFLNWYLSHEEFRTEGTTAIYEAIKSYLEILLNLEG